MTKPRLTPETTETVAAAYDRYFEAQQASGLDQPLMGWHRLARQHLPPVHGARVLDIGCGRGAFAEVLVTAGAHLVAADLSPRAVEITRSRLERSGATVLVADVEELPFPDESFDVVISLETLEHVPRPEHALGELVRVTRRGGKLLVTTPNYLNLHGLYRVFLRLVGRSYREAGDQPINHPLLLFRQVRALKALDCRVDVIDGNSFYVPVPGIGTIQLAFLERFSQVTKWFALETITVSTRS